MPGQPEVKSQELRFGPKGVKQNDLGAGAAQQLPRGIFSLPHVFEARSWFAGSVSYHNR
jgi:hypothetical protein